MSNNPVGQSASTQLQAFNVPGGRGRAACTKVFDVTKDFATALRRAVPFLARRRVAINAEMPRCVAFAELAMDITIVHAAAYSVGNSRVRGLIMIDESALARILDGVLGGDGATSFGSSSLSSAQIALASRVSTAMMRAFAEVMQQKLDITINPTNAKEIESGTAVVVTLALEGGGRVLIAIPLGAIPVSASEAPDQPEVQGDPGIAEAMTEVELDVVAELGKVRLPLEAIANLAVGDVLKLALPLDTRARVSAGGAVLFQGRPTAKGEAVAVSLERQISG